MNQVNKNKDKKIFKGQILFRMVCGLLLMGFALSMSTVAMAADANQVKRLKRSIKDWNQWRKKNPSVVIDLTYADLSDCNLQGANLSGAKLYKADLSKAKLSFANLYKADLQGASLYKADLSGCILIQANLLRTSLIKADLRYANFLKTNPYIAIFMGNLQNASTKWPKNYHPPKHSLKLLK